MDFIGTVVNLAHFVVTFSTILVKNTNRKMRKNEDFLEFYGQFWLASFKTSVHKRGFDI